MEYQCKESKNKRNMRDADVDEIYLSNRELDTLGDFSKYRNLKRLYLNKNKIFRLSSGLKSNLVLTELYLQDNQIFDINGCIEHLTCLQILLLQNNQLTSLTDVVHELRQMMDLKVLSLMNNPLALEYHYRDYVIHKIKSVELFDRREVKKSEREKVFKDYEVERQSINNTIAFGRRVEKSLNPKTKLNMENNNVILHEPVEIPKRDSNVSEATSSENVDEIIMKKNITRDQKHAEAIEARAKMRAVMEIKVFDWMQVLKSREQKCNEDNHDHDTVIHSAKWK